MTDDPVIASIDPRGVATLVLHRPHRGNAYDTAMLVRMRELLEQWQADAAIRLVVLRGEGKHFCTGADLGESGTTGLVGVCRLLDLIGKPTIALVHGACIGGGFAFVSCCDIVIAERSSFFSVPEVRIGFAPAPLMPFFVRAIGARQMRRYGLSGERFTAEEGLRMGLVHEVVESLATSDVAAKIIDACLLGAPGAIADTKRIVAEVESATIDQPLLDGLQKSFDAKHHSPEAIEGKAAFREKRAPDWATNVSTSTSTSPGSAS